MRGSLLPARMTLGSTWLDRQKAIIVGKRVQVKDLRLRTSKLIGSRNEPSALRSRKVVAGLLLWMPASKNSSRLSSLEKIAYLVRCAQNAPGQRNLPVDRLSPGLNVSIKRSKWPETEKKQQLSKTVCPQSWRRRNHIPGSEILRLAQVAVYWIGKNPPSAFVDRHCHESNAKCSVVICRKAGFYSPISFCQALSARLIDRQQYLNWVRTHFNPVKRGLSYLVLTPQDKASNS